MALVDNLIEHWSLDNTLNGSLGAINLTAVGTAFSYGTGVLGQDLVAPGVAGRYKTFPYNSALTAGTIAFSYKATGDGTGGFHRIIGKTQVGVTDVLNIGLENFGRQPVFVLSDTQLIRPAVDTFTRGTWYNHVITWNGTTAIWYVNGTSSFSAASTDALDANTTVFTICGWAGNTTQQPAGEIDHIAIWSRALSSTEVTQWNNGNSLLAYPFVSANKVGLMTMGVG